MGYRRLDINLLPPEMQPGPVVRYAVIINTILIGITVAFLVVDSFLGVTRITSLRRDIQAKQELVRDKASVISDYNELIAIENHVNGVGRLISLASAEYVDMPVIMERISRLVPDGVSVNSVNTERRAVGSVITNLRINLSASRPDPDLIIRTFNAFKADPVLGNCYMRMAEYEDADMSDILDMAGVDWQATGPDVPDYSSTSQFTFEIHSEVVPPVEPGSLATELDNTRYFDVFSLTADAGSAAQEQERVAGGPEGVTVVEAN